MEVLRTITFKIQEEEFSLLNLFCIVCNPNTGAYICSYLLLSCFPTDIILHTPFFNSKCQVFI